jgi:ubiquinone biosynthesis accessory factor UbiJ
LIADNLIAAGLDRLFAQTPGARDLLAPHAGRTLALDLALFRANLQVGEGGGLYAAPEAAAEAVIFITPDVLLRLPAQGKAALRELRSEGDAELLSAFNDTLQQLDLDAEAELSRLFGPIVGFRLAEAGRAFGGWMKQATEDTARAFAEYAVEESPMLASQVEVARFNREVDELRDDAARLEARLNKLSPAQPEKAE